MFWIGLIAGIFIGANIGILVIALCRVASGSTVSVKRDISTDVETSLSNVSVT